MAAWRSSSLRGHNRPWISPPMHFIAAAAITPSGVPPTPKRMSAPVSGHAVDTAPITSPSGISHARACGPDFGDEIGVAVAVEDDGGDLADRLALRLRDRLQVLRGGAGDVDD